jgi:threonine dehydratase
MGRGRTIPHVVTLPELQEARERVAPVLRPTPVEVSDSLSGLVRRDVLLKPEQRQRTGSFKIRGAYNFVSRLPAGGEVVAASAGNHAQGVALAAQLSGLRATVFMPLHASTPKVDATRSYGATVRLVGEFYDEAMDAARRYAEERGLVVVPPFDDPLVIAGQGTIGLELVEEAPDAGTVVVPVGGGGLISGIASALRLSGHPARTVGVQAEGAAAMRASLAAGHVVTLERVSTMADGIAPRAPSNLTLEHVQAYVDSVVTVTEDQLARAMLLLLERAKAVVEPAGAAAVAALLAGKVPEGDGPAVAVVSGGNVDLHLLSRLIGA